MIDLTNSLEYVVGKENHVNRFEGSATELDRQSLSRLVIFGSNNTGLGLRVLLPFR
jgi:hypothetical protein